jgi:hypothetical protein
VLGAGESQESFSVRIDYQGYSLPPPFLTHCYSWISERERTLNEFLWLFPHVVNGPNFSRDALERFLFPPSTPIDEPGVYERTGVRQGEGPLDWTANFPPLSPFTPALLTRHTSIESAGGEEFNFDEEVIADAPFASTVNTAATTLPNSDKTPTGEKKFAERKKVVMISKATRRNKNAASGQLDVGELLSKLEGLTVLPSRSLSNAADPHATCGPRLIRTESSPCRIASSIPILTASKAQ